MPNSSIAIPKPSMRLRGKTNGERGTLPAGDNEENSSGWVNSFQIRNYAMTPAQIAVLGGPTADGIPAPE